MPTLTTEEIVSLTAAKALAESSSATYTAQVAALNAKAADLLIVDNAFKKYFDYYNDNIIGRYDGERLSLNGNYIAQPIEEADIVECSDLNSAGRITPQMPITDVVRIAQFDGGPLLSSDSNEVQHIADQATIETALISGYDVQVYPATLLTTTSLTPASTTLDISDSAVPIVVTIGKVFVVKSGSDLAVIRCIGRTLGVGGPPYTASLNIQYISPPVGTITSGKTLEDFNGFTNAERVAKTATDVLYQPLMNTLIANLKNFIGLRQTRLSEQAIMVAANEDPDAISQLTTAASYITTSGNFLTAYLTSTDVSDSGITSLATERGIRSPQITTRLIQINANYTGQAENYYARRYVIANDRANTSRGSLRRHKQALLVSSTSSTFASALAEQAISMGNILP